MKSIRSIILLMLMTVLTACGMDSDGGVTIDAPMAASAPSDTPEAPESPPSGLACLSGTWELVDVETYMNSILPPELAAGLTFVGSSGFVSTDFRSDGTYTYSMDEFLVQYTMDMGGGAVPMEVHLDGEGHGIYKSIEDNTIRFTDLDSSALRITFSLAGEAFDLGTDASTGALSSPEETVDYECSDDTLFITPPLEGALPVEYTRSD